MERPTLMVRWLRLFRRPPSGVYILRARSPAEAFLSALRIGRNNCEPAPGLLLRSPPPGIYRLRRQLLGLTVLNNRVPITAEALPPPLRLLQVDPGDTFSVDCFRFD